jgi:uncharacterized Zn-binding protein involved in type VI secretion
MPGAIRDKTDNVGGGLLMSGPQSTVFVEGKLWCVVGWQGQSHPPCPDISTHCAQTWTMVQGSPNVRIQGIPVCRKGDLASCQHPALPGSVQVFANGR